MCAVGRWAIVRYGNGGWVARYGAAVTARKPVEAAMQLVWEIRTPLGRPVVPEEKRRQVGVVERVEGGRWGQGRRGVVGVGKG